MPIQPALDLAELRAVLEEKASSWQYAYTSMTALTEAGRVIRLGVPLPDDLDEEQLSLQSEVNEAAAKAASASRNCSLLSTTTAARRAKCDLPALALKQISARSSSGSRPVF